MGLTLKSYEKYINDNGHLPDMPSAEDVASNGVSLGTTQAKLLQKIEELTLYLIEQNKEIEKQKEDINNLKYQMASCGR